MQSVKEEAISSKDRIGSHSTQLAKAVVMYRAGVSAKAAADKASISRSGLYRHLKFANLLRKGSERFRSSLHSDPSEETIWKMAEEIRSSWTGEERAKRYVGNAGAGADKFDKMCGILRRAYAGAA
jgi:hypothetical protein